MVLQKNKTKQTITATEIKPILLVDRKDLFWGVVAGVPVTLM